MRHPAATARNSEPSPALSRVPVLLAIASAVCVAFLVFDRNFSSYDDGIAAEGARLILLGKVPYRDFWALYSPGSYYANAAALLVFGESLLSIRLMLPVMVALQAGLLYGILRRTAGSSMAIALGMSAYLTLLPISLPITSPLAYWFTALLAACYCLVRWASDRAPHWDYAAGTLLGVSALFRQDGGVYAMLAVTVFILVASRVAKESPLPRLGRMLGSFAIVIALMLGYLASRGALAAFYEDAVRFAIVDFPGSRTIPYPVPWHKLRIIGNYIAPVPIAFAYQLFSFYLLPLALLVTGILSLRRLAADGRRPREVAVAAIAILALVLLAMIRSRPSGTRIVASAVLSLPVFAALIGDQSALLRRLGLAGMVASLLAYVPFGAYTVWAQRAYGRDPITVRVGLYSGSQFARMLDAASVYITKHISPSEKILSGSPIVYFTSGRQSATVYSEPHPKLTDTAAIQLRVIRDMKRANVGYFVRSREWGADSWFTIEEESQPRILIDYIKRHFDMVQDIGLFQIYKRRPGLLRISEHSGDTEAAERTRLSGPVTD